MYVHPVRTASTHRNTVLEAFAHSVGLYCHFMCITFNAHTHASSLDLHTYTYVCMIVSGIDNNNNNNNNKCYNCEKHNATLQNDLPIYHTVSTLAGCFTVNAANANTDWLHPYKYCMC